MLSPTLFTMRVLVELMRTVQGQIWSCQEDRKHEGQITREADLGKVVKRRLSSALQPEILNVVLNVHAYISIPVARKVTRVASMHSPALACKKGRAPVPTGDTAVDSSNHDSDKKATYPSNISHSGKHNLSQSNIRIHDLQVEQRFLTGVQDG